MIGGTGTLAIDPTLYGNVGYDPRKDFAPVGLIGTSALVILVNPVVPAHSVAELIALAKSEPWQAQLRLGRRRQRHPSRHGAVRLHGRRRAHPHSLQGLGPGAHRPRRRSCRHLLLARCRPRSAWSKEGKVRALGGDRAGALDDLPRHADRRGSRPPGFEAVLHYGIVAPAGTPQADHHQAQRGFAHRRRCRTGQARASPPTGPSRWHRRPTNTPPTSTGKKQVVRHRAEVRSEGAMSDGAVACGRARGDDILMATRRLHRRSGLPVATHYPDRSRCPRWRQ